MKSKKPAVSRLPSDYSAWLTALEERVRSAQLKAATRVNRELISLYWDIGRFIITTQKGHGYGKHVVDRLAIDLQSEFPGIAGFSPLNVWRMRAFFGAYAHEVEILSQAATELSSEKMARPVHSSRAAKALRDLKKPIGVAEWRTRLVESLPKKLQGSLPTVAEIERELGGKK